MTFDEAIENQDGGISLGTSPELKDALRFNTETDAMRFAEYARAFILNTGLRGQPVTHQRHPTMDRWVVCVGDLYCSINDFPMPW